MNSDRLIRSCWDYKDKLYELDMRIRIEEDRLTSTTARYEGEPVSGGDSLDSRRQAEARLADLQTRRSQLRAEQQRQAQQIRAIIAGIDDANQRTALELRYCDLRTWKDIAKIMRYSEPSVYRIHAAGLDSFNRQCNKLRIR